MYKLNALAAEPKQQFTIMLDDINRVTFNFEYKVNQLGWFFGFQFEDTNYQNIRLTTSYNILRAYQNWLPFGLRCDTVDGLEPMDINDFVSGYATVYLLTPEDVKYTESNYYAKIS